MNVLLAVDGSDYTKRMLAYVGKHEGLLGPTHDYTAVTVVTAIPRTRRATSIGTRWRTITATRLARCSTQ